MGEAWVTAVQRECNGRSQARQARQPVVWSGWMLRMSWDDVSVLGMQGGMYVGWCICMACGLAGVTGCDASAFGLSAVRGTWRWIRRQHGVLWHAVLGVLDMTWQACSVGRRVRRVWDVREMGMPTWEDGESLETGKYLKISMQGVTVAQRSINKRHGGVQLCGKGLRAVLWRRTYLPAADIIRIVAGAFSSDLVWRWHYFNVKGLI